jgi:tetratricopeptide (TPR) repeat protein
MPTRVALIVTLISFWTLPSLARAHAHQTQNTSRQVYHVRDPEAERRHDLLVSAQSHMDKQDYAAAAAEFKQYLAKQPNDAAIHFQLGYAYTALKKPADAEREYTKAVELDPKMAPAQLNLGLTLLETDPAAAVAPLRQAAALMPNQARPEFLLGWALERSGQAAEAIEKYRTAEKLEVSNFDIHMALARTLLASRQFPEAQTEFRAALAIKPDTPAAHLGLAQCLIAQKKPADAVPELRGYLKARPSDDETRLQLAGLLRDLGKTDQALGELKIISTGAEVASARKMEAEIYEQQKDPAQAAAALAEVVKASPNDANAHAELGHLYLRAKNYPAAAKELAAALQLNPNDDTLLTNLVAAHYLGGDFAGALNVLAALEQRGPLTADEWYIRALCNDKVGRVPDAYAAFEKFLAMNNGAENNEYFVASARARALESELKNKKK